MKKEKIKQFTDEVKLEMIEQQNSDLPHYKRIRKSYAVIALGIILIIFSSVLGANMKQNNQYKNYDSKYEAGMKTTLSNKKSGDSTLYVLHRTGCKDCEAVESTVTKQLSKLDEKHKNRLVVYDMKKLSLQEQAELNQRFHTLLVSGNHMPSPTFIVANRTNNIDIISDSYSGSDKAKVKSFISDWSEK